MKKSLLFVGVFVVFSACNKEKQVISRQIVNKRVDSILSIKLPQVEKDANRDLEHRITIELKVKSDSILNARRVVDTVTRKRF